jgi:tetraacyldisaccharide-1-P 4'-kinase
VWLVTGVAQGKSVLELARASGYQVLKHVPFPDHARYIEPVVRGILAGAKQAGAAVAVTGKDWVKWRDLGVSPDEVRVLEPELAFEEGRELWNQKLWGG